MEKMYCITLYSGGIFIIQEFSKSYPTIYGSSCTFEDIHGIHHTFIGTVLITEVKNDSDS